MLLFSLKPGTSFNSNMLHMGAGMAFIFGNLLIDGFTCANQDKMTRQTRKPVSAVQSLCYLNVWIFVFLAAFLGVEYLASTYLAEHFLTFTHAPMLVRPRSFA